MSDTDEGEDAVLLERPVDRVTTDFFRDIVDEYVAEDRLQRGYARFDVDDEDRERRFVVEDDLPELSDTAYVEAEVRELVDVLDRDEDVLDQPVELSIPVGDADRVREEVEEDGTVTVLFQPEGVQTLLEQLLAGLDADADGGDGDSAAADG